MVFRNNIGILIWSVGARIEYIAKDLVRGSARRRGARVNCDNDGDTG